MSGFTWSRLAVPSVSILILFSAYSSQVLFSSIEPKPLSGGESVKFNLLISGLWISYYRTCATNPGQVPKTRAGQSPPGQELDSKRLDDERPRQRWCRKCDAYKPQRSHHCKTCGRCIPKMDHHCPWTSNCVSYFTFPHFFRFLLYAVVAMIYLQYFLYLRVAVLWRKRHQPSYLGPSALQLAHLFSLCFINSLTLFAVSVTFVRTAWSLGSNVSTIESWEIERHERLVRRARVLGGYLDGPDGIKVRIQKQEFPFDIGIWPNIKQGMGGFSILTWLFPFAPTPRGSGVDYPTNGFEDAELSWPPPDPDRMPRYRPPFHPDAAFTYPHDQNEIEAFQKRQERDLLRRQASDHIRRRKPFHLRQASQSQAVARETEAGDLEGEEDSGSGEEGWQDSGGNRLKDYGVDEEVEFYDEENVPISELLLRRKARA